MTDTKTMEDRWADVSGNVEPVQMIGVIPHLGIPNNRAAEAIAFYAKAFAATEAMPPMIADDGKRILHSQLLINGAALMLADDFPEYSGTPLGDPAGVTLHLQVDNADRWFERAVQAGATPTMPLADMFWGDRYGQVKDPFGHSWSIGAPIKKGA